MSSDRPNLAGAFTKPSVNRAAGLTGLLPASRPARSAEPVEHTESAAAASATHPVRIENNPQPAADPAPTSSPATPRRQAGATKQRVSEQANIVSNVAVYLEPDLLELTRARRRTTGMSYDELTGEAFAAIGDDQLVRVFQPAPGVTSTTGMPTRQRRPRGTAGIQIQLRLDTNQRAWIDQKQQSVGAPSRSALVAAALRLHLTA
ncbi:hypothetical protein GCM10025783_29660 [Amnibacterium soli]|uniref:Ribbon-helix-helix protein CopG domain-containing protein n=1 Tax=Amnibacterium soli TaxID=1282736 RepID=A0ABP8ZEN2_9MICO